MIHKNFLSLQGKKSNAFAVMMLLKTAKIQAESVEKGFLKMNIPLSSSLLMLPIAEKYLMSDPLINKSRSRASLQP